MTMRYLTVLITLLLAVQGVRAEKVAQAIWCSDNTLYFDYSDAVTKNSTYKDGVTVTEVYNVPLDTYSNNPAWNISDVSTKATKVVFKEDFNKVTPKSCKAWFDEFVELKEIEGLKYLNTSEVVDMGFMFENCKKLEKLDVSTFDVKKVTNVESMFQRCSSLKTIYCDKTWSISGKSSTFSQCDALKGGIAYDSKKIDGDYATPINGYFTAQLTLYGNSSNATNLTDWNGYYGNFTLKDYTLYKDGNWSTLCLPFDVSDFTGTPLEGATVKELVTSTFISNNSNSTLSLTFSSDENNLKSIEAGKPYIVKWASGEKVSNPVFYGVTINNTINNKDAVNVIFTCCLSLATLNANDNTVLYLADKNELYYPSAAVTVGAFHAYFQLRNGLTAGSATEAKIRNIVMNFDGEDDGTATGIASLSADAQSTKDAATWYTLDGRRLNGQPTQKGIYINNGKKFMVK